MDLIELLKQLREFMPTNLLTIMIVSQWIIWNLKRCQCMGILVKIFELAFVKKKLECKKVFKDLNKNGVDDDLEKIDSIIDITNIEKK